MLEQSLETLEQHNMMLLFPFCLLKFRREVKKPGTTSEKRKQLADEMKKLLLELEELIEHSHAQGLISSGDAVRIMQRIDQMYDELYDPYPEFKEARMELEERLKIHWDDVIAERERKLEERLKIHWDDVVAERERKLEERLKIQWDDVVAERERKAKQEERNRFMQLLKQGYTVEQLEKIVAKEAQQTATATL